jgi:hypothetical protein
LERVADTSSAAAANVANGELRAIG